MAKKPEKKRCAWPTTDALRDYHDTEWGVPVHDDVRLFEAFVLGGAQAGLSWSTVLNKRAAYREAFDQFDPESVARFNSRRVARLLANPGIIRNRLKIASTIQNARAVLDVQDEFGSFDAYLWRFVDGRPIVNRWKTIKQLPASTPLSDKVSKDMKSRGFNFVGSTICYATMQGIGMINDHLVHCFRHAQLSRRK